MRRLSVFVAALLAASAAALSFPPSTASDAGRPSAVVQGARPDATPR